MMWKYIGLLILVRMATSQYGPLVQSKTRHRTTTTTEASDAANEVLPPSPYQPPPGYKIPESELPDQPPQQPSQPPEPSSQQPEQPSYHTQQPPKSYQPPQPPYQPPQSPPDQPQVPPQPPYQPPQSPPNQSQKPPQPPYQPPQSPPDQPQVQPQPPYQPPQSPPNQPQKPPQPPYQPPQSPPTQPQKPPQPSYQPPQSPPNQPPKPPQPPYQPPQSPPNQPQQPPQPSYQPSQSPPNQPQQPPQPPYQPPQSPPDQPPKPPQPPYQPPQSPPNQPQQPPQPSYQPSQSPPNQPQQPPQPPYQPPQSPPDQPPKPPQPSYQPPQSSPNQPQKPPQPPYQSPQSPPNQPPKPPQPSYQPPQSPPNQPPKPPQPSYQPQKPPQPSYQPPQSPPNQPQKPDQPTSQYFQTSYHSSQPPPNQPQLPPQFPYQPQKPPQSHYQPSQTPYQPPQFPPNQPQQPPQSPYQPQQPPPSFPQQTSQPPPLKFPKPQSFPKPQQPPQYQPNQPYTPQKPAKTQFWWMDDANNPFKQVTQPQNQPLPSVPQSSGVPGYGPPPKPGFPPQPQEAISVQPQPAFPHPSQPLTGPKPSESNTGPIIRPIPSNSISPPPSINPDNPFFASALQNPIRNSEPAQSCTGQDYFCVSSSSCVNGLISGPLTIFKKGPCSTPGEVCCKKPGPGAPQQQPQIPYSNYGTEAPIQKYTGPLNTTPHPGCAAALKCVDEVYCTAEGVMSDTPVALTRDQIEHKVPLADCQDMNTGKIGKCCRDPNYKDPWPPGMMMDGESHDDGQYHPDDGSTEVPYNPHTIKKPLGVFNQEVTPFPVGPRPGQVPADVFPNGNPAALTPQQQYQPQQQPQYQPPQLPGQPQQPGQPQPQQPQYQPQQPQYQPQQPSQPQPQQPQYPPQQPSQTKQPQYQPQQPIQTKQPQYQPHQQPEQPQYQPQQPSQTKQPQYQPQQPSQPKPQQPTQSQFQPQQPPQPQPQPGQPQPQQPQPQQPDQREESQEPPKIPGPQLQEIGEEPSSQPQGSPATECGVRNPGSSTEPDETSFGEFPWHAQVVSTNGTVLCSAAIIAPNAVLTGAHCIEGLEPGDVEIKAGGWTLGKEGPRPSQTRQVAASAIHPSYNSGSLVKDEAILVGEEPLLIGGHVAPVCLAPSGPGDYQPTGRDCWVTGWGRPALQNNAPGTVLHKIKVELIPKDECEDKLKKTHLGKYFILNQGFSCALPPKSADLCKIDVGSPLVCERSDGHYELAGVYSWDTKCSTELPGITAASDTQWIQKVLATPLEVLKQQQKKTPLFHTVIIEDIDTKPGFALGYGK